MLTYQADLEGVTPALLEGFFVGWPLSGSSGQMSPPFSRVLTALRRA
jgi:hypothetical protein